MTGIFSLLSKPWASWGGVLRNTTIGVPWWLSRLRIWHCHCYGSGCCCGTGSIPDPGSLVFLGHSQKKKKGNRNVILVVGVVALEIPVLFLLSTARKIFRGELGPTFNLTSREVRCWPYYKLWLENTLSPHLQQK